MDINKKRRQAVQFFTKTGVLIAASPLLSIQKLLAASEQPVIQGVHSVIGRVTVNGTLVKRGHLISVGDVVKTEKGAHVIYVMGKDAYLQREQSEVIFGETTKQYLRVVTGKLLAVFGGGEKTLRTPVATMGIRGTGCYFEVEHNRTYFCLCYGWVKLIPLANPNHRIEYSTRHHDRPVYIYEDLEQSIRDVPSGIHNHSDDELLMLETLQNRALPFDEKSSSY